MECTKCLAKLDKELWCMCMRWNTCDEVNHNLGTRVAQKQAKGMRLENGLKWNRLTVPKEQ